MIATVGKERAFRLRNTLGIWITEEVSVPHARLATSSLTGQQTEPLATISLRPLEISARQPPGPKPRLGDAASIGVYR